MVAILLSGVVGAAALVVPSLGSIASGTESGPTFASSPVLMSMVTSGALQAALFGEQTRDTPGPAGRLATLAASIISLPVRALGGK